MGGKNFKKDKGKDKSIKERQYVVSTLSLSLPSPLEGCLG
jgi:hypothetical protein